jgi:outer membrane protein
MAWNSFRLALVALPLLTPVGAAQQGSPPQPDWQVSVGALALTLPRYPGSDEYRVLPLPLVQLSYQERVFLGPSTTGFGGALGGYLVRTPRFGFALELGLLDDRPASRADALAGMEDRDLATTGGASLSYRAGPVEALVGVAAGLNDGGGLLGTTRVSGSQFAGRFMLTGSLGATFANAKQMRREFGVTPTEAATREALILAGDDRLEAGDSRAYRPGGGLRHVGAGLTVAYLLAPRWSLFGTGAVERLSDGAAESPLVRQREQWAGGLGVSYRF